MGFITCAARLALSGCAVLLCACADMRLSNPFTSDPLTGGQDATTSLLLDAPIPSGMQRYSSHGYITSGENGARQGLETFRGNVDASSAAVAMFNGLKSGGWDLLMQSRKGERGTYVYQKGGEIAVVSFHPQGMLTIMEAWRGPQLEKGTTLTPLETDDPMPSLAGEEYGPMNQASPGASETFGSQGVEEKEL